LRVNLVKASDQGEPDLTSTILALGGLLNVLAFDVPSALTKPVYPVYAHTEIPDTWAMVVSIGSF